MELSSTEMGRTTVGAGLGEDSGILGLVSYRLSYRCLLDLHIEIPSRQVKESCAWGQMTGHSFIHPSTYLPTNPTLTYYIYSLETGADHQGVDKTLTRKE